MAFLQEELVNYGAKGWLGIFGTGDRFSAPDNFAWYEEDFSLDLGVKSTSVWLEFTTIPPANNYAAAQAASATFPAIISEVPSGTAIHLTPSPNQKVLFTTTIYNDWDSRVGNWIMPQMIPLPITGMASWGYSVHLWSGNPALPGSFEINTSVGQSAGTSRVGWFMHYGSGAIKFASDFDFVGLGIDPNDIWLTGFRYIGKTAADVVAPSSITQTVNTTASIGEPVVITGFSGSYMDTVTANSLDSSPVLGILTNTNIVTVKGYVAGVTVQNYDITKNGKPCYVNSADQLDADPTSVPGEYIKIVGYIVNGTSVYVSPELMVIRR